MAGLLFMYSFSAVQALTRMAYDIEPNNALHEAIDLSMPADRERIRVIGELEEADQDAYRLVVDEDMAARRIHLQLTGRGGALTQLDIFDLSELADGLGRIPAELTRKPPLLASLKSTSGTRAARMDSLLLAPGVYVLAVSHSGGSGAYELELAAHDDARLVVLENEAAHSLSLRGRTSTWSAGDQAFIFELNEEQAGQAWDFEFQTALARPATLRLLQSDGSELFSLISGNGQPLKRGGLKLAAGAYRFELEADQPGTRLFRLQPGAAQPVDGREIEPNDRSPTPIEFAQPIDGRLDDVDTDLLEFSVDETQVGQRFDLEITASPESELEVCLRQPAQTLQFCRRGVEGLTSLQDLGLSAGVYQLSIVDRPRVGTDWSLRWNLTSDIQAGEEVEPNDSASHPSGLHERGFGRGQFIGFETDYWRFSVTGEPQLWRLQLQGEDLHEIQLSDAEGHSIATMRAGPNQRVRLDNQYLMPGDYLIAASGTDADYTLRLQPLGPPPPGMELEPNNDVANARVLTFGQRYSGTLAESGDRDLYRISLLGPERFRLKVQPPADGSMQGQIGAGDEGNMISDIRNKQRIGEALEWELSLPAGDYVLSLFPGTVSDAEYSIEFERLDWLSAPVDREPNDVRDQAVAFPADGQITGRVGGTQARRDWYRLPTVAQETALELPNIRGLSYFLFTEADESEQRFELDRARDLYSMNLQPGQGYLLSIRGDAEYAFDLSALTHRAAPVDETQHHLSDALALEIDLNQVSIQAFSPWAQQIEGTLRISAGTGLTDRSLDLATHLTQAGWKINGLPAQVEVMAGSDQQFPFTLSIPADVPTAPSARLSVRLADPNQPGQRVVAAADISADLDTGAVNPSFAWAVPEVLRGGFNAAALRFGSEPVDSPGLEAKHIESMALLFDGLARYGRWTEYTLPIGRSGRANYGRPTVRLAGDAPVPVRGFLINPTSTMDIRLFLKDFQIAVSLDGEQFEPVLNGTLQPTGREQAFVLDEAVQARYVRLIPLTANLGDAAAFNIVRLGEFKVIADAGWRPHNEPLNLADPVLGGHLVWADPWIRKGGFDTGLLLRDEGSPALDVRGQSRAEIVLGFEHLRAARIGAVGWTALSEPGSRVRPARVRVFAGSVSPIGPWSELQQVDWTDDRVDIMLDQPVWARYLRFVFELDQEARTIELPDQIEVFEADGPSVLGEWGHLSSVGPLEAEQPPVYSGLVGEPDHSSRDRALELLPEQPQPGRALLDQYSSWYRLTVPADQNQLELSLSGRPTLEGAPRLIDAAGAPVDLYSVESDGYSARWQAWVQPGGEYWLEVYEPPRSVIFSWDTSGSVAAWLPTISAALMRYAETVKPGRDEVNLLPFGYQRPLLENWMGYPYPLTRMMASYPRETSSSEAEAALATASRELIDRPGKKAVLLLTDAATGTSESLWSDLQSGQPQVFAMKLTSEGAFAGRPETEIDLMQNWARVRGGHFQYVSGFGSLAHGFERAVTWLKRPVDFSVEVNFAQVEDPAPATLQVMAGETGLDPTARGAVAMILDASGSMLKRMQGSRRIDIAKAAIRRTVEESLPDGLPLALRVYGHREAGSCRTDLEIPLTPLNKADFLSRLEPIEAINLARTPIADSIAAVKGDLSAAEGRKLVVLLTDGEETCDGDPAAAIEALQTAGIDVRINIVGFAIDNETLKAQFTEWAELGGGDYLDAADAEGLDAALEQSLRIPFVVRDQAGIVVAEGVVDGDTVQLPPGRYRLEIEGSSQAQELILVPGDEQVIELQ